MDNLLKFWLLGMGILPEQIDTDVRLMADIAEKDGVSAWRRLEALRYQNGLKPYPEFDTPNAQLEFISFVEGKPSLWMP